MRFIKKLFKLILIITIIMILTVSYMFFVEPNMLTVNHVSISKKQSNKNTVRVVQFSDTHLGEAFTIDMLKRTVKRINKQKPDIVVFTGDLIDHAADYPYKDQIGPVLSEIEANVGKYAIWGNHDYGGGGVRFYETIMKESGFELIKNESVKVKVGDNKEMNIYGLDDALLGNPDASVLKDMKEDEDFNLLLLHEPDEIDLYGDVPVDLALAGHSHGGQVRIPFIGAIYRTSMAKKYTDGLYDLGKYPIYVCSGLGTTRIAARFLNPPQISVFDLPV